MKDIYMENNIVKDANRIANRIFTSNLFCLLMFALSVGVIVTGAHVAGLLITCTLVTVILLLCDDIKTTTVPVLCAAVFLSQCYDSYNTFIKFAWIAVPVAAALIFNFIAYRKKFKLGLTFYGLCAVSVAVTFGGVGSISASEYFAGASLYSIAGLGVGMLFAYIIVKSRYVDTEERSAFSAIARALYLMGLLVCFLVIWEYSDKIFYLIEKFEFPIVRSSNNFATYLMFALPIPFYYSIKNKWHIPVAFFMYICLLLIGSRGGILMGSIELVICLIAMIFCDKRYRLLYIVLALLCIVAGIVGFEYLMKLSEFSTSGFISSGEPRSRLLARAIEDFKSSPIFGKGLGYMGNSDIYNPVKGALPWYHMMIPQIFASMGLVGVLCYGFCFYTRGRAIIKKLSPMTVALGLSYVGVFLMSQVNPGEFCPIPYQLLAVMIFVIIENMPPIKKTEKNTNKTDLSQTDTDSTVSAKGTDTSI